MPTVITVDGIISRDTQYILNSNVMGPVQGYEQEDEAGF